MIGSHGESLDDEGSDREIKCITFGPKNSWYILWNDGTAAWESLPPALDEKLHHQKKKKKIISLSMTELGTWIIVYHDGKVETCGISVTGKLEHFLQTGKSNIKSLVLGPAGGWILVWEDGTFEHERLPSGLSDLLSKRTLRDPQIDQVALGAFGSWIVRFNDGECVWDYIPRSLERFLIQMIRKGDPNMFVSLSPSSHHSYFIAIGDTAELVHDSESFKMVLRNPASSKDFPNVVLFQ